MSAIGRFLGVPERPAYAADPGRCVHPKLMPRWRDHLHLDDATSPIGYVCHRCHAEFLPSQVAHLLAAHARQVEVALAAVAAESEVAEDAAPAGDADATEE